ncbi:MAG: hypothetical protein ACO3PC_08730 [Steroidobacteraceae bacterium]
MRASRLAIGTWCALLCAEFAWAVDTFPGVSKAMTPAEYARAGLDKLSPEERRILDEWIARYTGREVEQTVADKVAEVRRLEVAAQPKKLTADRIVATITPPFEGWSGKTTFTLDNGQVWKQRLEGRYRYSGTDTRVTIAKNFFGFYVMTLEATGRSIGVERVR